MLFLCMNREMKNCHILSQVLSLIQVNMCFICYSCRKGQNVFFSGHTVWNSHNSQGRKRITERISKLYSSFYSYPSRKYPCMWVSMVWGCLWVNLKGFQTSHCPWGILCWCWYRVIVYIFFSKIHKRSLIAMLMCH